MKLEGNITIFVDGKGAKIEVEDASSGIRFLEINLSSEQFMSCLGRLAMVKCDINVKGIEKVGKTMEISKHEFEIPDYVYSLKLDDPDTFTQEVRELAQDGLMDGWIADSYFGSKDSFFTKDNKQYARVTIRRWV